MDWSRWLGSARGGAVRWLPRTGRPSSGNMLSPSAVGWSDPFRQPGPGRMLRAIRGYTTAHHDLDLDLDHDHGRSFQNPVSAGAGSGQTGLDRQRIGSCTSSGGRALSSSDRLLLQQHKTFLLLSGTEHIRRELPLAVATDSFTSYAALRHAFAINAIPAGRGPFCMTTRTGA